MYLRKKIMEKNVVKNTIPVQYCYMTLMRGGLEVATPDFDAICGETQFESS